MFNSFYLSASGFFGSISEWYQGSVICELLNYLEKNYFSVNFDTYQNFSISASTGNTVRNLILGLAIGIIVASAMTVHTKRGLGGFVRTLLNENCNSPENAKTLSELGYFQNIAVRRDLKKGVSLGKLVRCCEQDAHSEEEDGEFVIDPSSMHFYIPEDLRYRAEIRFDQKGSSWKSFIITLIATVIGASLLCIFLPDLFRFADNIITWLSPK